jgi:hypothetical protein
MDIGWLRWDLQDREGAGGLQERRQYAEVAEEDAEGKMCGRAEGGVAAARNAVPMNVV